MYVCVCVCVYPLMYQTRPEEHCRRYFLTVFVATTFRMFVGNLDPRSRELVSASVRLEMQAYKKALSARAATKVCVSRKRCVFLSNVLSLVAWQSRCTRALTFQNFCVLYE
jgi:hypothetical protein